MIPASLHGFFWDVDPTKVDPDRDAFFVIERLLEHGNDGAIEWVMRYYSDDQRLDVIRQSRRISRKTARLWQNYYGLSDEDIRCLSKSFRETESPFCGVTDAAPPAGRLLHGWRYGGSSSIRPPTLS